VNRVFKYTVFVLLVATFLVGCGGKSSTPSVNNKGPLDPQGNWLFNINGTPDSLHLAGTLFELNPPVVTSSTIGPVDNDFVCDGSFTMNGSASGVSDITLTAQQVNTNSVPLALTLTGTIAVDQAHMSGTWSVKNHGPCLIAQSGTWDAQLLTSVTGNWAGKFSDSIGDINVTASFTENVDQTKPDMGKVNGTITLLGSPCFSSSDTFSLAAPDLPNIHTGEILNINPLPDQNGVKLSTVGKVTPDGTSYTALVFKITGGVCDGRSLQGGLTKQ
jgi:hypothetical protein